MGKRILVIDDSLTLRQFIRATLNAQMSDAEVVLAKDGREGLTSAQEEAPDLILLDFILPDLRGDAVCEELLKDPRTAGLPVVLMSSNVAEITRTQSEYENVVRGLAKPFKAELLCSTLTAVLANPRASRPDARTAPAPAPAKADPAAVAAPVPSSANPITSPPAPARVAGEESGFGFRGDIAHFPIFGALQAIEEERATGVLSIDLAGDGLEISVCSGAVVLLTCRTPSRYLEGADFAPSSAPAGVWEKAQAAQARDGCPVYLSLAKEGIIPDDEAARLCLEQGWRLFAPAWSARRGAFSFASVPLPAYAAGRAGFRGSMTSWSLESLRRVRFEHLGRVTWCRSSGVPSFTRLGYERIQQISLNDDEVRFAELIQNPLSIEEIARAMGLSLEATQHLVHRFVCLEICDYWPVSYLQRSQAA